MFGAGLVVGLGMGAFAPEAGLLPLMLAAAGLLGDPLIYNFNIWLRGITGTWHPILRAILANRYYGLYGLVRVTTFATYYLSVGYVIGYTVGFTMHHSIDWILDRI
jgi:hypothetical protein